MKKRSVIVLALAGLLCLLLSSGVVTYAEKEDHSLIKVGNLGDNIIWELYTDGDLIVKGSGDTYDFYPDNGPFIGEPIKRIFINAGITSIGNYVFEECSGISSIVLPVGVKTIGEGAFSQCDNLKTIDISQTVTNIEKFAFAACSSLYSVVLPRDLKVIEEEVFCGCESLKSVEIPEGVTSIGYNAFGSCFKLDNVVIPDSVTSIGKNAFDQCRSLKNINIPKGVTIIEDGTFWNCNSLTEAVIPEGVTHIGSGAFRECDLISVTIPEGVNSMGSEVFGNNKNLKTVTIPESLTESTGYGCLFAGCDNITDVYYGGNKQQWEAFNYANGFMPQIPESANVHLAKEDSAKDEAQEDNIQNTELKDEPKAPDEITVLVNDKKVIFDQPPIIENGRTLVPLRAIFEALNATVKWDGATRTVTAANGFVEIQLQIGSNEMSVGNEVILLDVPAKIVADRTMIPVRAVSEAFGCEVDWDNTNRTVIING